MALPVESGRLIVGTTALQVDGVGVSPVRIWIHNENSTSTLHLGGPDVTVENGFALDAKSVQDFTIYPGQSLWMVSPTANHEISYLRIPV